MINKPILILIAGGGGAGKSTITKRVAEHIRQREKSKESVAIFQTDYLTNSDLKNVPFPCLKDGVMDFLAKAEYMNDISSFDEDLILDKIKEVANKEQTKVILLEGTISLSFEKIREFAGLKIYIETDADIRLIRRVQRRDYYKKLVGETIDENLREDIRIVNGNSLKEELDLWIERKKIKSLDRFYDENILAKKKFTDLTLTNNYKEDFEKNFKKITKLIDLYFENEEEFKNSLKEENRKLEKNILSSADEMVDQSQEELKKLQKEKQVWEEEKDNLKQQIQQLQFQITQQKQEQIARVEKFLEKK